MLRLKTGRLPVLSDFGTTTPVWRKVYLGAGENVGNKGVHGPYLVHTGNTEQGQSPEKQRLFSQV